MRCQISSSSSSMWAPKYFPPFSSAVHSPYMRASSLHLIHHHPCHHRHRRFMVIIIIVWLGFIQHHLRPLLLPSIRLSLAIYVLCTCVTLGSGSIENGKEGSRD